MTLPQHRLIDEKWRREHEQYVLDARNSRFEDFTNRMERLDTTKALYAGEFGVVFPDETAAELPPQIMNLVQVGVDENARLVTETAPQVRCDPLSTKESDVAAGYLEEAIVNTHWDMNEGEVLLTPQLVIDLAVSGSAFLAITADEKNPEENPYPIFTRLDPSGVYPDIVNGKMLDCMVVTRMKQRQVERMFGVELAQHFSPADIAAATEIEVIDFYEKDKVTRVLVGVAKTGVVTPASVMPQFTWYHELGKVPIAYAKLPTADGAFRGIFDQVKGIVLAQNRIFQQVSDYADQQIFAPFFANNVENDTDPPGPNTIYRGRGENAAMVRVQPAGSSPQLYQVLEYLERQARSGVAYPAQRQGEVQQSIASAAFINSTLGQLTTQVRFLAKQVAFLRRQAHEMGLIIEKKFLPGKKRLSIPTDETSTYDPAKDIKDYPKIRVIYGAGAGLDALNKKAALTQDIQAGLTSKETGREQLDYIPDPKGEKQKVQMELLEEAALQRMATDPQVGTDLLMRMIGLMRGGKDFAEASDMLADLEEKDRAEQLASQNGGGPSPYQTTAPTPPGAEEIAAGANTPATTGGQAPPGEEPGVELPPLGQATIGRR